MSRQHDDYEWLTSVVIAIIAAFLALALVVASHAAAAVQGAYSRRGRSSRTLQTLAVCASMTTRKPTPIRCARLAFWIMPTFRARSSAFNIAY